MRQDRSPTRPPSETTSSVAPKSSRFRFVSAFIQEKQNAHEIASRDPLVDEVITYFDAAERLPEEENPMSFWLKNALKYPALSELAFEILTIPATSAPVERLFSQASIAAGGKRNRLSSENLEREVMVKVNKQFL